MNNHQNFSTIGEEGYLALLQHILDNGYNSNRERTGTGTIVSPTPHQLHFPNVAGQFPLITTKEVSFNMLACEMLWFISGETNANRIEDIGSHAMTAQWLKWANEKGELGPVYGKQWRDWLIPDEDSGTPHYNGIDQLQKVIDSIKDNPESRRHVVTAWNPAQLRDMALPPCHLLFKFKCEPISEEERRSLKPSLGHEQLRSSDEDMDKEGVPKYKLHLHMFQRSCDMFLGVPFNIAEYALLLLLISHITNTVPGNFTWTGDDCHIYQNHIDAVKKQLGRTPKDSPRVILHKGANSIDDFEIGDISLTQYKPHGKIKAKVSV